MSISIGAPVARSGGNEKDHQGFANASGSQSCDDMNRWVCAAILGGARPRKGQKKEGEHCNSRRRELEFDSLEDRMFFLHLPC